MQKYVPNAAATVQIAQNNGAGPAVASVGSGDS
jgi:hypothetical protein